MATNIEALSEKEKETLRLIVRGHDAKSIARHFNLSVHTVNERLRDARRKMAVSSSREAARQLLDQEGEVPQSVGDKQFGEALPPNAVEEPVQPENGAGRERRPWIIAGVALMSLILALVAVTSLPQAAVAPADTTPSASARSVEIETAARRFLTLIDQGKWNESYALTASSFQKLNTSKVWAEVSEQARPPLGALISRTMISHEDVPTPPNGHELVKFRTNFANKANAIEKVSLQREGNGWRVAGVTI
jgi:DNA-binding CsgD family transcriptional regulator